ncbi:MAG: hypothetical protein SGILL_003302 [Bacillariaceae sp.]
MMILVPTAAISYLLTVMLAADVTEAFYLHPQSQLTHSSLFRTSPPQQQSTQRLFAGRSKPFKTKYLGYNAYVKRKQRKHQRETLLGRLLWKWQGFQRFLRRLIQRTTVYVLECEDGKYYVGSTVDPKRRFRQHFENPRGGSKWTKFHRPVAIKAQIRRVPEKYLMGLEAQVTAEYMLKYGVNNVRGAYFSNPRNYTLDDVSILTAFLGHYGKLDFRKLEKKLRHTLPPPSSAALRRSHRNRKTNLPLNNNSLADSRTTFRNGDPRQAKRDRYRKRNDVCYKCGQVGHWANECPTDRNNNQNDSWNTIEGEVSDEIFLQSIVNGTGESEEMKAESDDEL